MKRNALIVHCTSGKGSVYTHSHCCVCVCVCVCTLTVCVCVCVHSHCCVCVCVCALSLLCVCVCVCVCVCSLSVPGRASSWPGREATTRHTSRSPWHWSTHTVSIIHFLVGLFDHISLRPRNYYILTERCYEADLHHSAPLDAPFPMICYLAKF